MYRDDGKAHDDSGDDGGMTTARLATRVMSMEFVNGEAMADLAFKVEVGNGVINVERDIRRPLMWLTAVEAKYGAHPNASKLNELVQIANNCKTPAARKAIKRAVDLGMISEEKHGREVYYYLSQEQFAKAIRVLKHLRAISEVVRRQTADPFNETAGSELIDPRVYYNIIAVAHYPPQ